ncbi:hypothetical protein [Amphritea atlantica]|jgi:hypothetical protein|nr:hypothetical protein [Amphritea atlantica]
MMNSSPITTWEGAEAYFTFADSPSVMMIILALAMAATVGAVVASVLHENHTYIDYK